MSGLRERRSSTAAVVAAVTLVLGALGTRAAEGQGGFTATERRALDAGELVERPSPEDRGGHRYLGGTSYRVVDRSLPEVWAAIHDVGSYRHMLPSTNESTVVETTRTGSVLRVGHNYGPISAHYHLVLSYDDTRHHLDFELDRTRPSDIEAARGFLELRPYLGDAHRTLVIWASRVDPGASFLIEPLRPEIQRWVLRVPSTMRTYLVDGRGRDRYLP